MGGRVAEEWADGSGVRAGARDRCEAAGPLGATPDGSGGRAGGAGARSFPPGACAAGAPNVCGERGTHRAGAGRWAQHQVPPGFDPADLRHVLDALGASA